VSNKYCQKVVTHFTKYSVVTRYKMQRNLKSAESRSQWERNWRSVGIW